MIRPAFPIPTSSSARRARMRLSNFLLWQAAYAELVFLPILWPDFDDAAFVSALDQYAARERRFGALVEPAARQVRLVRSSAWRDAAEDPTARIGAPRRPRRASSARICGRASPQRVALGSVALAAAGRAALSSLAFWWVASIGVLWEWQRLVGGRTAHRTGRCRRLALARRRAVGAAINSFVGVLGGAHSRRARRSAGSRDGVRQVWAAAGVLYAGAARRQPCAAAGSARAFGLAAILWLFAVVWGTDIAAYFAGRLIGGPKSLAERFAG